MTISHEAIYQAIYVRGAGGLKRGSGAACVPGAACDVDPTPRQPAHPRIPDMVPIVDRPEEALGRAVPVLGR